MLNRRTQLLLDEARYRRLERRARRTRRSVAAVIRDAIDEQLEADDRELARREAGAWLLSQPLSPDPEPDWATTKRELLDAAGGAPAA